MNDIFSYFSTDLFSDFAWFQQLDQIESGPFEKKIGSFVWSSMEVVPFGCLGKLEKGFLFSEKGFEN